MVGETPGAVGYRQELDRCEDHAFNAHAFYDFFHWQGVVRQEGLGISSLQGLQVGGYPAWTVDRQPFIDGSGVGFAARGVAEGVADVELKAYQGRGVEEVG